MARKILSVFFSLFLAGSVLATKHTVTTPGFFYDPATLTVNVGDTVIFAIGGSHNVREVSSATWETNGIAALAGGFSTPFGGGQVVITSAGDHFYVCVPHASSGMKGRITANTTTGNLVATRQDNPFTAKVINQKLRVSFTNSASGTVGVFDLLGNKLYSGAANDDLEVSLAGYKTGVYFVILNDSKRRYTQRFLYRQEE